MLLGAAGLINPTLGSVLQGVTSPKEAIAEIGKSKISADDKIKLQQLIYDQQNSTFFRRFVIRFNMCEGLWV